MTFTVETLVPSTSPRSEAIGETKMTSLSLSTTQFTSESLVASASGKDE